MVLTNSQLEANCESTTTNNTLEPAPPLPDAATGTQHATLLANSASWNALLYATLYSYGCVCCYIMFLAGLPYRLLNT